MDDSAGVERVVEGSEAALVKGRAMILAEAFLDNGAVPRPAAAIAGAGRSAKASTTGIGVGPIFSFLDAISRLSRVRQDRSAQCFAPSPIGTRLAHHISGRPEMVINAV